MQILDMEMLSRSGVSCRTTEQNSRTTGIDPLHKGFKWAYTMSD